MIQGILIILLLAVAPGARADAADENFQPSDALYAPEEMTPTAQPVAGLSGSASYYSQARLLACDFAHGGRALEGAELFVDGQFVGKSPLLLNGFLVSSPHVALSARLPGYAEALRPSMLLPAEGEARIYLVGDNAASWYSTPAMIVGLLALGGSIAAYSQNRPGSGNLGLGLVIGGCGLIAVSQVIAHFIHIPSLEKKAAEKNSLLGANP